MGYFISNGMAGSQQNLSTTLITVTRLVVPASAGKRFQIYEIDCSQNGAPNATDCDVEWACDYADATTAGTSTAATPYNAVDTAVTLGHVNYTAEPTAYTVAQRFWHRAPNQRGTAFWQCGPGDEIVIPASASQGPGLRAKSPNYAATAIGAMRFREI